MSIANLINSGLQRIAWVIAGYSCLNKVDPSRCGSDLDSGCDLQVFQRYYYRNRQCNNIRVDILEY